MSKMKVRQFLYRWHIRIGVTASLLVMILAITGILLNHTAALNLPHQAIESEWLLAWYDMPAADTEPSLSPAEDTDSFISSYPQRLSLDQVLLDLHTGRFWGNAGPYVMDAAAIFLLLLACSGLYNWGSRKWK